MWREGSQCGKQAQGSVRLDYVATVFLMFTVEIRRTFSAVQGLPSPVRAANGLPPLELEQRFQVTLRVGFCFRADQLGDRGWFIDTDALDQTIDIHASRLAERVWTEMFSFRPTFENVAKWLSEALIDEVPQLAYVELDNETIGVATRYDNVRSPDTEVPGLAGFDITLGAEAL